MEEAAAMTSAPRPGSYLKTAGLFGFLRFYQMWRLDTRPGGGPPAVYIEAASVRDSGRAGGHSWITCLAGDRQQVRGAQASPAHPHPPPPPGAHHLPGSQSRACGRREV